jgi:Protein of unknown function (DUF1822)
MQNLLTIEFERLPTESITLDSLDINQAVELSNNIPDEDRTWETYINALGLFTFKRWLEERDSNLQVNWEKSTIAKPSLANVIPTVTNLEVGNFKVALITIGSLFDEQIPLSRLAVESPECISHFYILVEVLEEHERGIVRGFITYPQLIENLAKQTILKPDWTYRIPLTWFDPELNRVLLYLRALEPQAITLPAITGENKQLLATMESQITQLLPTMKAPSRKIWEVLSWEQGSVILNSPELVEWIYKLQTSSVNVQGAPSVVSLRDTIKIITQPAINLGRWLWNEIDEVGQALSWTLLPQLAPLRTALRSPEEEFGTIVTQLQAKGIEISPLARCGYNNFLLAGLPLRVYAAAWNLPNDNHSWSLLLILGSTAPNTLPHNLKLRVSDQTQILVEQAIDSEQPEAFLYTRVVGDWDEKFIASVSFTDGVEVTLPPFAFDIRQG